jgi:hypothetical protein
VLEDGLRPFPLLHIIPSTDVQFSFNLTSESHTFSAGTRSCTILVCTLETYALYPQHSLVLDYLCHSCYTRTAGAFNRDSTIRHLDADGDEIVGHAHDSDEQNLSDDERPSDSAERFETRLTQVKLRQGED